MYISWIFVNLLFKSVNSFYHYNRNIRYKKNTIYKNNNYYLDTTFHGIWNLKKNTNITTIINVCPNGKIENPSKLDNYLTGVWYTDFDEITLIMLDYNSGVNEIYHGKTTNNTINITGTVVYGNHSPDYIGVFEMTPVFPLFHNISLNYKSKKQIVNYKYLTGQWLFENINTNTIYIFNLYDNFTWDSRYLNNNLAYLGGIWDLYDSDIGVDLTTGIHIDGDYIWLWCQKLSKIHKNRLNLPADILLMGKITHLSKLYYSSDDSPSSNEITETKNIVSKINGTVIYGMNDEPENSESFYMIRWWE